MNWPMPQDFNEAVQNPFSAFADPDLKGGQAVVGPTGLPLPRSGNFADVYQVRAADGRDWALKCFTRPVTGLEHRYAKLADALAAAGLPFTIGFSFHAEGVRVRGEWYPALKMEWVDGLLLNQVVREQAGNPRALDALGLMWARLCKRLRDAGVAHADLQHGNVLLVPGAKPGTFGLKLIDYDGMYVPALGNTPSGESGHPNFQHPGRAGKAVYSPDLDRFPHLVIATALKGLAVLGPALWERYDTGDNLLFTEDDFRAPAASELVKELWRTGHPELQSLVGQLVLACGKSLPQTPWLDLLAPDGVPVPLSAAHASAVANALGLTAPPAAALGGNAAEAAEVELVNAPAPSPATAFDELDEPAEKRPRPKPRVAAKKKSPVLPLAIGAAVLLIGGIVTAVVMSGGKKKDEIAQKNTDDPDDSDKPKPKPKPTDKEKAKPSDPVVPPPDPEPPKPTDTPLVGGNLALDPAGAPTLAVRWESTAAAIPFVEVSPDGASVVVREAASPRLSVFAAATGRLGATFTDGMTTAVECNFLADGNVASWHQDQPVAFVWNPNTGKSLGKIPVGTPPAGRVARIFEVSPGGRYVVTGYPALTKTKVNEVGRIAVFDAKTGRDLAAFDVTTPTLRFTPDGSFLLVADATRFVTVKLADGTTEADVPLNAGRGGRALAVSYDGLRVLYGGGVDPTRLLDARTGRTLVAFPDRFRGFRGAMSRDDRLVALPSFPPAAATDRTSHFEVIDLAAGRLVGRYPLSTIGNVDVVSAAFTPDNSALVFGRGASRQVVALDLPRLLVAVEPPKPTDPPPVVPPPDAAAPRWAKAIGTGEFIRAFFSPDGQTLYVHSPTVGRVEAFDARSGKPGLVFKGEPERNPLRWIAVLDRDRIATAAFGPNPPLLWDGKTGEPIGPLIRPESIPAPPEGIPAAARTFAVSPSGRYVFVGYQGRYKPGPMNQAGEYEPAPYRVVDIVTEKPVLSGEWRTGAAAFSADSSSLVIAETTGKLKRVKLPGGTTEAEWTTGPTPMQSLLPGHPSEGEYLLYFGPLTPPPAAFGMHLLDAKTGQVVRTFPGSRNEATLSRDGLTVAYFQVGFTDRQPHLTAVVVESGTGRTLGRTRLDANANDLGHLEISPDLRSVMAYNRVKKELAVYPLAAEMVAATPKPKDADPVPKPQTPTRPAVPPEAALAKAETSIRNILKDEYAKKLPAEKKALADKLLALAEQTTDDPAARYVMLRDVTALAVEGSDATTALLGIDGLAKWYEVDGDRLKLATLEKVAGTAGSTAALRAVAELALVESDEAVGGDDYAAAIKFATVAAAAARKGGVAAAVIEEADFRLAQARKADEAFAALAPALETLKTTPDDAAANLAVGKYRCFTQGRWDDGLKHLVKGGDAALKAAAEADAAVPRTGVPDIKVADTWWDYAQAAPAADKPPAEARARHWYARAATGLSGFNKTRAEERAGFVAAGTTFRPGVVAEFTAEVPAVLKGKKARLDATIDFSAGEFSDTGLGRSTKLGVKWTGMIVAPRAGRYKLAAVTDPKIAEQIRVRVNGKTVIDTLTKAGKPLDGTVTFTDRPAAVVVEFASVNTNRHRIKLTWVPPGGSEEVVPAEVFFHDTRKDAALGK